MTKILFISHDVPPIDLGVSTLLQRIFRHFPKDSYVILMPKYDNPFKKKFIPKLPCKYYVSSASSIHNGCNRWTWIREWFDVIPMVLKGVHAVKKEKIDHILVCPHPGNDLLSAYLISIICRIPMSIYFFDCFSVAQIYGLRKYFSKTIERISVKRAANIFVMSEYLDDFYKKNYGVKSILVPHPIDIEEYDHRIMTDISNRSRLKTRIVYTGNIYEAHLDAVRNLVDAVSEMDTVEFHIYSRSSVDTLKKMGIIGDNVIWHGYVEQNMIAEIQMKADILFMPLAFHSPYQSIVKTASPGKLPEYLAAGRPIIVHAPSDSYISWYAKKNGWAYIVDELDKNKLKEAILKIMSSEKLQQELILNAKKTVLLHESKEVAGILTGSLGITSKAVSFEHFILTRFNVRESEEGVLDENWLGHRFKLFSNVCFSSVKQQSENNFRWLVFFDSETPQRFRKEIDKYVQWDKFMPTYVKGSDVLTQARIAISKIIESGTEHIITTRIDNDDAICKDFVKMVQDNYRGQECEFINFTNGCVLTKNGLYLDSQKSNPFVSLVEGVKDFRTVWCAEHNKLSDIGPIKEIVSKPAWLQVVHNKNVSNSARGQLRSPFSYHILKDSFSIKQNLMLLYIRGTIYYALKMAKDLIKIRSFKKEN